MTWLNYHHLYYFSIIAQEGGVAKAARKLRLTHSTLSAQLRALEAHFDAPLFDRKGKKLVLTPFGAEALSYASDIFRLGRELDDVARGRLGAGRDVLRVGVAPGLPKTLAHQLLAPAMDRTGATLVVRQAPGSQLTEMLTAGRLQVILTNETPTSPPGERLHFHPLGATEIALYGCGALAKRARHKFPASLSEVPFVLPPAGAPLRALLDAWFVEHGLRPLVKAEVDDAGLMRVFGAAQRGIFPVRSVVRGEVEVLNDVQLVGPCQGVRETYYAATTERRIRHRGVTAIMEAARAALSA